MKSYEEMARYVLEVRDKHEKKQQKRKLFVRRYAPLAASFCAFILVGLGVWKNLPSPDKIPPDSVITTTETVTTASASGISTTLVSSTLVRTGSVQTSSVSSTSATNNVTSRSSTLTSALSTNIPASTHQSANARTTNTVKTQIHTTYTTSDQLTSPIETTTHSVTASSIVHTTISVTQTTVTTTLRSNSGAGTRPWSEYSINYRYNIAHVSGLNDRYLSSGVPVREFEIEGFIAEAEMSGYDSANNEYHTCIAEAYHIKDMDEKKGIAIKFHDDNEYHLYCRG